MSNDTRSKDLPQLAPVGHTGASNIPCLGVPVRTPNAVDCLVNEIRLDRLQQIAFGSNSRR